MIRCGPSYIIIMIHGYMIYHQEANPKPKSDISRRDSPKPEAFFISPILLALDIDSPPRAAAVGMEAPPPVPSAPIATASSSSTPVPLQAASSSPSAPPPTAAGSTQAQQHGQPPGLFVSNMPCMWNNKQFEKCAFFCFS